MSRRLFWALRHFRVSLKTKASTILAVIRLRLSGAGIGPEFTVCGWLNLSIHPESYVTIGSAVRINSGFDRNAVGGEGRTGLQVARGGRLTLGTGVAMSNVTIVCSQQIVIEDEVFIGGGCRIYDTDFHAVHAEERVVHRTAPKTAPITIGRRSFIGGHSLILKGITIGEGAVIGAGSVVTRDVPPYQIWAGNPIRLIGRVAQDNVNAQV